MYVCIHLITYIHVYMRVMAQYCAHAPTVELSYMHIYILSYWLRSIAVFEGNTGYLLLIFEGFLLLAIVYSLRQRLHASLLDSSNVCMLPVQGFDVSLADCNFLNCPSSLGGMSDETSERCVWIMSENVRNYHVVGLELSVSILRCFISPTSLSQATTLLA